jgi:hypothetical protein
MTFVSHGGWQSGGRSRSNAVSRSKVTLDDVRNKRVFFDDGDGSSVVGSAIERQHRLRSLGCTEAATRLQSDIIVAGSTAELGQRTAWIAALLGLTVISHRLFWKGSGPAVVFTPAVIIPRKVCMTESFRQSHPTISRIVCACARMPHSRWTVVDTTQAVPRTAVVLSDVPWAGVAAAVYSATDFLAECSTVSLATTGIGA